MRRGFSIPDGKLKQKVRVRQEGIRRHLQKGAITKEIRP